MNRIPRIGNRITEIQSICLDLFLIDINQDQVITGVFQNHAVGQGRTHMPQTNNTNFFLSSESSFLVSITLLVRIALC